MRPPSPMGRQRPFAIALALVLSLGAWAPVCAVETTLPEERLERQMSTGGDVDAARREFAALLDQRLSALAATGGKPGSIEEVTQRAARIDRTVRTLRAWESAEARLRLRGGTTPDDVVARFVKALDLLDDHTKRLERSAAPPVDPEAAGRWPTADIHSAIDRAGDLFLASTAFLRGTGHEHRRGDFLAAGRRRVSAPGSLAAFDAGRGKDLATAFGIRTAPPAVPPLPPAAAPAEGPAVDEETLRTFVRGYQERVLAGDIRGLRPFFVPGYFPKAALRAASKKFAGWTIQDPGKLSVHDAGGGELEVEVADITLVDPNGVRHATRSELRVRDLGQGRYGISSAGPQGKRTRGTR